MYGVVSLETDQALEIFGDRNAAEAMIREIAKDDRRVAAKLRVEAIELEKPELTFRQYAIAFHLAATRCPDNTPARNGERRPEEEAKTPEERAMESYEDDMLLHAHRYEPPFHTRVVPSALQTVTVRFPAEVSYESEGTRTRLRLAAASGAERTRNFAVALGETVFHPSEVAVLSLVLTPPPCEASELNEYDVIKLVKLWEGGEGIDDGPSSIAKGRYVSFATAEGERATLHDLAASAFPGWQPLDHSSLDKHRGSHEHGATTARTGYRVGTVELELPPSASNSELFGDIATLKRRREAPTPGSTRWDCAVAVGGILQGLLDFRHIEDYELADVFADVDVDPERKTMRAFHKGTLLSLSVEERESEGEAKDESDDGGEERPDPIGVDPYLAIPNIVLLHDQQRLEAARRHERDLSSRQRGPLREWHRRAAINKTENGLSEIARLLAQSFPNVFHYSSERRLQKRGRESRGLDDLEAFMRLRMDDLSSVLQWRVRRRDRWTAVLGIAVGVVTAFLVQQAIEGRPLWLIVLAAVALFSVFLYLREKLF